MQNCTLIQILKAKNTRLAARIFQQFEIEIVKVKCGPEDYKFLSYCLLEPTSKDFVNVIITP